MVSTVCLLYEGILILMIDQPGKYLIKFGIESKVSSEITSTRRFKHHLVQALRDMRRICESK